MNFIYATSASINKKGVVARAWYRKHSKMDTTEIKGMRMRITLTCCTTVITSYYACTG